MCIQRARCIEAVFLQIECSVFSSRSIPQTVLALRGFHGVDRSDHGSADKAETLPAMIFACFLRYNSISPSNTPQLFNKSMDMLQISLHLTVQH